MGYTHYWRGAREITPAFLVGVGQILDAFEASGEPLDRYDVSLEAIHFNGCEPDCCEDFDFLGETFCKTRREPYDVAVTAVLALAAHLGLATVTSDGEASEWADGVELAREATGLLVANPPTTTARGGDES